MGSLSRWLTGVWIVALAAGLMVVAATEEANMWRARIGAYNVNESGIGTNLALGVDIVLPRDAFALGVSYVKQDRRTDLGGVDFIAEDFEIWPVEATYLVVPPSQPQHVYGGVGPSWCRVTNSWQEWRSGGLWTTGRDSKSDFGWHALVGAYDAENMFVELRYTDVKVAGLEAGGWQLYIGKMF